MLEFTDNRLGSAQVVATRGRIDNTTANLLEAHCDGILRSGHKSIILDFEDLQFLSSAGLRVILTLAKKIQAAGGKLVFCGLKGSVKDVFDIAGFTGMFPVYANLELAADEVL